MSAQETLSWAPRYGGGVLAYCWRCFRSRVLAWIATALAIGAVLAVAANTELVLVLAQRSLAAQAASASQYQVFLSDSAPAAQVTALQHKVAGVQGVKHVSYRSKEQAIGIARENGSLSQIASGGNGNPFPASLVVTLNSPAAATRVSAVAVGNPAVDASVPTSYTPGQAKRLTAALTWAKAFVVGIGVAALGVAALVAMVLIRAEVRYRRAELRILSLVGAPRPVIRLPLLFEAFTLALAGSVIAVASLLVFGTRAVSSMNSYLPFLQLGATTGTVLEIGLVTLLGSILALGACSLLVRLPR
ncbi:MAG: permease-like cell division protein FtsX [Candidatus Dormiibacterota bacterium]